MLIWRCCSCSRCCCCCCIASRCFCTYCFTGVQTGQLWLWHFWWCFSSSRDVTHLRPSKHGGQHASVNHMTHGVVQHDIGACRMQAWCGTSQV